MAKYTALQLLASSGKLAQWRTTSYSSSESQTDIEVIPMRGMKTVVYKSRHLASNRRKWYDVFISFGEVKFGDSIEDSRTWIEIEYKGETYYFEKPDINKNPVKVRCGCPDYEFRFSFPNYREKVLYGGTYKHYTRKTPPPEQGGRPHVNPENHAGMCKHLFNMFQRLQTLNAIK